MVRAMSANAKDAIVVLGCRVGKDGRASGALLRRCQRAATAFQDGLGPLVVACGGRRWHGRAEAEVMRATLLEFGVPADRVVCELYSYTTRGNARHGGTLLRQLGASKIALVTCDFHLRRALWLFRSAGFDAVGLSCQSPRGGQFLLRMAVREALLLGVQPGVS
jgi:uncharacterized SAM-binding protein YcdF (DUF218 family)